MNDVQEWCCWSFQGPSIVETSKPSLPPCSLLLCYFSWMSEPLATKTGPQEKLFVCWKERPQFPQWKALSLSLSLSLSISLSFFPHSLSLLSVRWWLDGTCKVEDGRTHGESTDYKPQQTDSSDRTCSIRPPRPHYATAKRLWWLHGPEHRYTSFPFPAFFGQSEWNNKEKEGSFAF